jgi:hypothetical protein
VLLSLYFFQKMVYSHIWVSCRLNNTNPTVYPGPGAILANINNADCSETIPATDCNVPVGTGYTVVLADMSDETKVCCSLFDLFQRLLIPLARQIYAVSQPFEVKAQGASYPVSTATPSDTSGATAGTATSTSTGSGSSTTGSSKANGAFATFEVSAAGVLAAIGAAIGML